MTTILLRAALSSKKAFNGSWDDMITRWGVRLAGAVEAVRGWKSFSVVYKVVWRLKMRP